MARARDIDFRQYVLTLIVVLVGIGLTWSATYESIRTAEIEAEARFRNAASLYTDRLKSRLENGLGAASDIYRYYRASGEMDAETFEQLISSYSSLNDHRKMVGVVIATTLDEVSTLQDYGAKMHAGGFTIQEATTLVGSGAAMSTETQPRAFYMLYSWAPEPSRALRWRGADLGAFPPINRFLEQVLANGEPAGIPMPPLETRDQSCVLLASPFAAPNGVEGLIVQIVEMPDLLADMASNDILKDINISLSSTWDQGRVQHGMMVRDGQFTNDQLPPPAMRPWVISSEFMIGAQSWDIQPWAEFSSFPVDYGGAVITASVCLILTGLVVFIVWSQSQRAKRVAEIVNRRTRALKEAHEELENHYRMLQNLNKDVEEARRSAETANKAKSEFLATMSHELRTPLNAILGFSQILQEQPLGELGDQRYVDYAKDINTSGTHLLSIINDILDLAKLEAGKIQIEQNVISSKQLVGRAVTLLSQQAEAKGVKLASEFADNMPDYILGDELRLRQILINLGSNAIKFTNKGNVTIRLHPRPFPTGQAGWILEVEDTGIGIPEEKQATLFDRFTQVDTALSRRHGGVGLGLAICRELVDQMSGKISVRSMVNVGTTVRVHLPLTEADADDDDDGMI